MNEDIEFVFDVRRLVFLHEPSGYTLTSQLLLNNDTQYVIDEVYANTGKIIDKHLAIMLRTIAEDYSNSYFGGV